MLQTYEMTGVTRKVYTILIPHKKATRESALNVCKTRLKIKHKPDHKGCNVMWTMVCKGSFTRFLTVKYST